MDPYIQIIYPYIKLVSQASWPLSFHLLQGSYQPELDPDLKLLKLVHLVRKCLLLVSRLG